MKEESKEVSISIFFTLLFIIIFIICYYILDILLIKDGYLLGDIRLLVSNMGMIITSLTISFVITLLISLTEYQMRKNDKFWKAEKDFRNKLRVCKTVEEVKFIIKDYNDLCNLVNNLKHENNCDIIYLEIRIKKLELK